MKSSSNREIALSIKLLALASLTFPWTRATAAPIFWDGVGGAATDDWAAVANWSLDTDGLTAATAIPGTGDVATFSATTVTTAQTVKLNANRSVAGLDFTLATATTLTGGSAVRVLTLGASGITKNNSGLATIGSATAAENVSLSLSAAQTWSNSDAAAAGVATITVVNGVSLSSAGAKTLTLDGSSLGDNVISGVITNGAGTLKLEKKGAGLWHLGGANTFTGGVDLTAGTLRGVVAGAFGPNTGPGLTITGGNLELRNDAGTTFTGTNTTVLADASVTSNRATAAGTTTTHTLGTLSMGNNTLTTLRGAGITGTTALGNLVFGATLLTGNATFAPQALTTLTLGSVAGSVGSLRKTGTGAMILSSAGTYTGGTTISAGTLQASANDALGTGPVNYPAAGLGRLLILGGVTIPNAVSVDAGITGSTGFGLLSQTGTGQAMVSGVITMAGNTSVGGTLGGGAAVGNELVVLGPINAGGATSMNHRLGRVIYAGGGSYAGTLSVTDTALVGATNGMPTGISLTLGGSASATLDLATVSGGFDQTLAALSLGNTTAASQFIGTVTLGGRTLTLNGNLTTISNSTQNVSHPITATAGGTLAMNGANRNITVADTLHPDDLVISGANLTGTGGVTKAGAGTLVLKDVISSVPLTVSAGTLATSQFAVANAGTLTTTGLNFGSTATTVRVKVGALNDTINGGTVTTGSGIVTLQPVQNGAVLAPGTYPLINYTGTPPNLSQFTLAPFGHATATLVDANSAISLQVTANEGVSWNGTVDGAWNIAATNNWKTTGGSDTNYLEGDSVSFVDNPTGPGGSAVTLATNINPSNVSINNSTVTSYTIAAATAIGITGTTNLSKTGNGTAVLRSVNSYTGSTFIDEGVLELDHDAINNLVLTGTSVVFINTNGTLRLTRDGGAIAFSRTLTGDGTVEINPHSAGTVPTAQAASITGNNVGFSGALKLLSPVGTGTARLSTPTPAQLGSAVITVQPGNQLFVSAATFTNALTIGGIGYTDASANIGALRLDGNAVWAGPVTVAAGGARIGSHNSTGTISGNITGGNLEFHITNYNLPYTTILTGTNSYGATTIGGGNTQTAGVSSMRVNIGNGGTTGTLGSGAVTLNGDGANGVLGFDRSDGYTLQQTITGGGSNLARTFIDFDTLGAGFTQNGKAITLGVASATGGGQLRVGQSRAGAILNVDGAMTGNILRNGSAVLATTNLNNGAVVNVATVNTALAAPANGSALNINAGATLNANYFTVGEVASGSGVVTQSGGTVNVAGQLRVGHFGTETSVYNLNGGSVNLTGANSLNSPSTAAGGGAAANGDNNLNTLAVAAIVGGGIYVGNDGTGIFNHNAGDVSTNWVVLDNRTDTPAGANMPTGIDQYNLSSGTLALKSTYGFIQRNVSAEFNLSGGTIKVDNTGNGTGTGANLAVPIDAPINTSNTATLDTNGATNSFVLSKNLNGTGTVTTTGSGTITLNPNAGTGTGLQVITSTLAGTATINKAGLGTTTVVNAQTYTGPTVVSAGRLTLPSATMATSSLAVADGASISGEPTVTALTLGATTGATLAVNPNSPGAITTGTLNLNGTTTIEFTEAPGPLVTSITLVNYTTKTGTGTIPAPNIRGGTIVDNGSSIVLNLTRANLIWSGASAAWDLNNTANWNANADKFFAYDNVTFDDTGTTTGVTLTGVINPTGITVNTSTKAYTLTGVISGAGGISKSGTTNLTLAGVNTFSGPISITGGGISVATTDGLGNGSATNNLSLDGGKLISTATMNLGVNRTVAVGANGATFSSGGTAAAYTVTIPGAISGSGNLNFTAGNTSGPTFALTGSLANMTGNINVDSVGASVAGATTLNLGAATGYLAGTITLAPSVFAGQATGIVLNGQTLPPAVNIVMNSAVSGANSYRSQIVSGVAGSTINSPISVNGTNVIQLSANATTGLTFNGPITAGGGGFTGTLFIRGTGTGTMNSVITMPGATLAKTDAAVWTINSTGNSWATTSVVSSGSVKLGISNALPITAPLSIGQADVNNSLLDLNGFDQEVPRMTHVVGTANNTRGIGNTAVPLSTLTVNNATANTFGTTTGFTGGVLQGNLGLVKKGVGTLTLGGFNTFTGPITVNEGTLEATASSTVNTNGGLGSPSTAGRTITANAGTTISLTAPNVLGTGVGNANLPTTVVNAATLATTRNNVLGALVLNAGLLTSSGAGASDLWQLKGSVTVGGAAASTISNTGASGINLDANTIFNVSDATASAAPDLIVATALLNQSSNFGSGPAGLTKIGAGTMAVGDASMTGPTAVNGGTLQVNGDYASPVTTGAAGTIGGNGTLQSTLTASTAGATVAPGSSVGTLSVVGAAAITNGAKLAIEIDDTTTLKADKLAATANLDISGAILQVTVTGTAAQTAYVIANYASLTGTFASTSGLPAGYTIDYAYNGGTAIAIVSSTTTPYASWANGFGLNPLTDGAPANDFDKDGVPNILEFLFASDPKIDNTGDELPSIVADGGNLLFTFRRADTAAYLAPIVEKSTDLTIGTWSTVSTGIAIENDGFGAGIDKIVVTLPMTPNVRQFLRVNVPIPANP